MIRKHPLTILRRKVSEGARWGIVDFSGPDATQLAKSKEDLRLWATQLADWLGETEKIRDNQRQKFIRRLRELNLDAQTVWVCSDETWNASYADFLKALNNHNDLAQTYLEGLAKKCEAHQREALEQFKSSGPLGISLNFVSPVLSQSLQRSDAIDLEGKKKRKIMRGLGRVLLRSNTKSSPFAMLNEVVVMADEVLPYQHVTAITPNTVHQLCVFEALALSDDLIDQVQFRINPNHWEEDKTIHVVAQAIDSTNRKVFRHRDRLFRTKINGPIKAVLCAEGSILNVAYLQRQLSLTDVDARRAIRTMVNLGLIRIEDHLTERLDGMAALLERMELFALPEEGQVSDTMADLRSMHTLWTEMTDSYSGDLHQNYTTYFERINKRLAIAGFDSRDALLLDQVSVAKNEIGLTKSQLNDLDDLLSIAPAFDINTLIQQELLYRLGGPDKLDQQDLREGAFFRLLTEVNLAFSRYWSDPFEHFPSQSPQVNSLQHVKQEFAHLLQKRFAAENLAEVEIFPEDINDLRGLLPEGIDSDGYVYSVFGQQCPDGNLVINNFYPGHMSFMHRYTRHLDLGEELNRRVSDFYHREGQAPIEIYETMGFNANVACSSYGERLLFETSRDQSETPRFERQIPLDYCRLAPRGTGIGLKDDSGVLRSPILASSLIRLLYPGQISFFAALFDNISFIVGLSGLFLRGNGDDGIVRSPRIRFRSIILERRRWLLRWSATADFRRALGSPDAPLAVASWLRSRSLPARFYFQVRRTDFSGSVHNIAQEFKKPQFFDVNDLWLVQLALSELVDALEVLISEELPYSYAPEFLTEIMSCATAQEV